MCIRDRTTTSEWDSGARPKIVISGNLVSGEYCEVYLYQYNSPSSGFGGDTNPVTINGNGPYDSSSSTDGTDYALPTFSGITQVDSNGEIEITFDRSGTKHIIISGISVINIGSNPDPYSIITRNRNIELYLDAGNTNSYPGSGTTWTDLSGQGNNGTLINGPTYNPVSYTHLTLPTILLV